MYGQYGPYPATAPSKRHRKMSSGPERTACRVISCWTTPSGNDGIRPGGTNCDHLGNLTPMWDSHRAGGTRIPNSSKLPMKTWAPDNPRSCQGRGRSAPVSKSLTPSATLKVENVEHPYLMWLGLLGLVGLVGSVVSTHPTNITSSTAQGGGGSL